MYEAKWVVCMLLELHMRSHLLHPVYHLLVNVLLPPKVKVYPIHSSIEGGVTILEGVAIPEQEKEMMLSRKLGLS